VKDTTNRYVYKKISIELKTSCELPNFFINLKADTKLLGLTRNSLEVERPWAMVGAVLLELVCIEVRK